MTDSTSHTIRSELVDIATGFLKNPKIAGEQMERKREFLQKKGLTDSEINHAFQLTPEQEPVKPVISNQSSSLFHRFLKDLTIAGLLVLVIKLIKQSFRSNQSNELNESLTNLLKSIQNMQASVVKLEQTADQLNLKMQTSNNNHFPPSSIEEVKQEIQDLKGLFLGRQQFPSRQLNDIKMQRLITDSENDGIIVLSEQDKKSDEENVSSADD